MLKSKPSTILNYNYTLNWVPPFCVTYSTIIIHFVLYTVQHYENFHFVVRMFKMTKDIITEKE